MPRRYGRGYGNSRRRRGMGRRPRRRSTRTQSRVPRGLKPGHYFFKRDIEEVLALSQSTPPEGWVADGTNNGIYKLFGWSLGSLGDSSDFTNLFRDYRIKGARVRFYFSNTASVEDGNSASNTQVMVRFARTADGAATALSLPFWQQLQAKKYKLGLNGGRPLDVYMPLKQENLVSSSTATANTMMTPKFINTGATNVVHYGMGVRLERVDGQAFTSGLNNTQYCRMVTTLYIECRQVK